MDLVQRFLAEIREHVLALDGNQLEHWLDVEPDAKAIYFRMATDLVSHYPQGTNKLDKLLEEALPEEDETAEGRGSPWAGFKSFIRDYLQYWRDVDFKDHVHVYKLLSGLMVSCANALVNPSYGLIMLQTSLALSKSLSKLVMFLSKQPRPMVELYDERGGDDGGERKSVVEFAADSIQKIFTTCLNDRSSGRYGDVRGKRVAIYQFANLTLKLLFACKKPHLAVQMLTNLAAVGPPLSKYPASQRVTFLYYLGRFHLDCDHYYRAQLCFEAAYLQCPTACPKHGRQIITHWIPCNLLLGRFPSVQLLQRPEAAGLADIFLPICAAIRAGDFVRFHAALNQHNDWLWDKGFFLVFLYRLRPLVWRSFTRKMYILTLDKANSRTSLALERVVIGARYVQKLLEGYVPAKPAAPRARPPQVTQIFMKAVTNRAAAEANIEPDSQLVPPPGGLRELMPSEGLIFGNTMPSSQTIEGVVAGLVYQGLMRGWISCRNSTLNLDSTDPLRIGWPVPFRAIMALLEKYRQQAMEAYDAAESADFPGEVDEVPGWVKEL